jgi:hypothetical protein
MPPARINKGLAKPTPKERPGMDKNHLANVRQLPCCVCGRSGGTMHPHHLLRTGEHGMGRKSSDRWCIPLDPVCHRALHDAGNEEDYLMRNGVDGRALASSLWACRDKPDALGRMQRVAFNFRQKGKAA